MKKTKNSNTYIALEVGKLNLLVISGIRAKISYIKFSLIEAEYLLSTTPNLGTPGYPYKKPKLVKNLVHVFHSISDISIYKKGSLDHYDSVILVGEFQIKSIRELEKKRGLKQKELLPLGVPYIDHLIKSKIFA